MKRSNWLALLVIVTPIVYAQDFLPKVKSLLPGPEETAELAVKMANEPQDESRVQSQVRSEVRSAVRAEVQSQLPSKVLSQANDDEDVELALEANQEVMFNWFKRVNALQDQVQLLTGKIEEQEYRLTQLQARHEKELVGLKSLISKVGDTAANTTNFVTTPATTNYGAVEFTPANPTMTDGDLYQTAYQHLQRKDYTQAKADFLQLIEHYPHGQYTPNAYYWLGEVHLIEENFQQAEIAFQAVIDNFSTHSKAGDAMFKLGVVALKQEQTPKAAKLFQRVRSNFPSTVAARLAESQLQSLKNGT